LVFLEMGRYPPGGGLQRKDVGTGIALSRARDGFSRETAS
jgi:hypothetical protein